jgi:hypothetical protein
MAPFGLGRGLRIPHHRAGFGGGNCLVGVTVIDSMTLVPDPCIEVIDAMASAPAPLYDIIDDMPVYVVPVVAVSPPAISGSTTIGSVLTLYPGVWSGSPAPVLSYQWFRNSVGIPGETSLTYTLVPADSGNTIDCVVTAVHPSGTFTAGAPGIFIP